MLFVAIKNCFCGYVLVSISGDYIERFFNLCVYRNLYIWDMKCEANQTTFKMSMRAFCACRDICRKTHVRLHILRKYGSPIMVHSFKKRYAFLVGIAACIAFFIIASQFVWTIEIQGLTNESEPKFRERLASVGLKEGAYKNKFDAKELKEKILLNDQNLAWVWVELKGAKVIVNVREKDPIPDMVPINEPCNVVSNKLGILVRKNVRTGVCPYQIGDTIFPGDVIISGIVVSENANIAPWYVHADGTLFLRTCYEKQGEFQLFAEKKIYTGAQKRQYYLQLLGRDFPFFFQKATFEHFDTVHNEHDIAFGGQSYVGIGYCIDTQKEYKMIRVPLSLEEAKKRAKKKIKEEMNKGLALHYTVVSEEYTYEETDRGTLLVTMNGQYEEQVGVTEEIDSKAPIEDMNTKENE